MMPKYDLDFFNLIHSFNLVQCVSDEGTYGFNVSNLKICNALFSDHMPVIFNMLLPCHMVKPRAPAQCCRVINSFTAAQFSAAFCTATDQTESLCFNSDVEALLLDLNSTCQTILDTVAPLKTRPSKHKPDPWLNDVTRAVRCECRRVEHKWTKDKLQVSFQMLRDSWHSYQRTINAAKTKHLSDIIASNRNNPHVLFKTINCS